MKFQAPNRFLMSGRPSSILWALALAGAVLVVGATRVVDLDIWWHLKTGEIIWLWRQIPRYDIYSYSMPGAPWLNPEWLFQVLVWLLYSKFGIASLTCLRFLLTAAIAFIAFRTFVLLAVSRSAALWGTLFMLWSISDRILDRPHLFSILFTLIFALRLHRFAAGRTKSLWDLPLLEVLWINLHGGGILGPMFVFAFAAGESVQARLNGPESIPADRRRHLWLMGLACTAASVINPNGIDVFLFSISHLKMDAILYHTWEWLPVLAPSFDTAIPQILFRAILVLTLLSYLINRRGARLSHLMLTVLTSLLVLKGKRFTPDFVIVNLPIIFFNLKSLKWLPKLSLRGAGRRSNPMETTGLLRFARNDNHISEWANLIAVAAISLSAVRYGIPATTKGEGLAPIGFGTVEQLAPRQMVDFLEENGIHGRVFNEMGLGGYLIFRRWPRDQVFIDGRTPVYGDDFYRRFVEAFHRPQNFEELDRRWHFDYMVFKVDQAWNLGHFHKYIWENPNWRLVYANPASGIVYLHNDPKFKEQIERLSLREHPLIEAIKRDEKGEGAK